MKKFFPVLLFFMIFFLIALSACTPGETDYGYFNNFSSAKGYTEVSRGLVLPEGVDVYSYDVENDVFITCRTALNPSVGTNSTVPLFGICDFTKVYVQPIYTAIDEIKGDYAIVRKLATYEGQQLTVTGVIKFRGGNEGELCEFSPQDTTTLYQFVGDYLVTLGLKDLATASANFSTFYDYSQGQLLEAFKLRCGEEYTFEAFDDYVVAIGKDHAFFYEKKNNVNGYLVPYRSSGSAADEANRYGYYVPYPDDTEGEYSDYMKIDIFYLGNGWFSRTAQLRQEEEFYGYQIVYTETDPNSLTGETKTYYANVRGDFYNARTHETRSNDWLIVRAVANRYHADYYTELSNYLNNLPAYNDTLEAYEYHLPYFDPSQMVKDGYSIIYYYYLPYVAEENYFAETSFCIISDRLALDRLSSAELLMPPAFIDGVGIPTSDPIYEPYFGSVYAYDNALNRTEVVAYEGGRKTYQTFLYNDGGIVAQEVNYDLTTGYYGIVSPDGRRIVDFEYDSLSPFYGEYAVGVRGKAFVRIGRDGSTTAINDAVNVRQGVYVYDYHTKLGLKNYAGDVLLDAQYDSLEVIESVMNRGNLLSGYVVTGENKTTTIYRLQ